MEETHWKFEIKALKESTVGMPGAAFVFGFECTLEDTLMAKDSGAFSSVNTQSETKGVLCWGDLDQDHTVHGASKESMNQCLEWIYQFL